jgi:phenylacetate-CoA ligase
MDPMLPGFDDLETRPPEVREAALMSALVSQVAWARSKTAYYEEVLQGVEPSAIASRGALARLPLTRKGALIELQRARPPFGGLTATPPEGLLNLYLSPGPIADPRGAGEDWWRFARALFAAGFRAGDRVLNAFSYHHTPAGAMFESAAHRLRCAVYPGGTGQTASQVEAITRFQLNAYTGTPDFLQIILDKARETNANVSSMTKALVTGGALLPTMRERYRDQGIDALQCYGTADIGLIAYESPARAGMIVDEHVIVEIVRPGTGDPVPDGEVGEVVVTTLNRDYPLIRFATGDLSAMLPGHSPCGRTAPRIRGFLGRADQTTKVKGMFVHPEQVARVAREFPDIAKARLVVSSSEGRDRMVLKCEASAVLDLEAIAGSIERHCRLRGSAEQVAPGTLPNDGKVIEDTRES